MDIVRSIMGCRQKPQTINRLKSQNQAFFYAYVKKSLDSHSKSVLRAGREHPSGSEESLLLTYSIN